MLHVDGCGPSNVSESSSITVHMKLVPGRCCCFFVELMKNRQFNQFWFHTKVKGTFEIEKCQKSINPKGTKRDLEIQRGTIIFFRWSKGTLRWHIVRTLHHLDSFGVFVVVAYTVLLRYTITTFYRDFLLPPCRLCIGSSYYFAIESSHCGQFQHIKTCVCTWLRLTYLKCGDTTRLDGSTWRRLRKTIPIESWRVKERLVLVSTTSKLRT